METINNTYEIIDKVIYEPLVGETFAVQGDNNSRIIIFKIKRYIDSVDLTTKDIVICYKNAAMDTGESSAIIEDFNNSTLYFKWAVPIGCTVQKGTIELYVEFRDKSNEPKKYIYRTTILKQQVVGSFPVYNNIPSIDTTILDNFIQANQNRVIRTDLVDDGIPLRVENRTIISNNKKIVAVCKDNLSQIITFRIKRIVDGVDRSNMVFGFPFLRPDGKTGIGQASNIIVFPETDEILVGWALDGAVTSVPGNVKYELMILGQLEDGSRYEWYTIPSEMTVENGLDIKSQLPMPEPSWFDSWKMESDEILKQASTLYNQSLESYNLLKEKQLEIQNSINELDGKIKELSKIST